MPLKTNRFASENFWRVGNLFQDIQGLEYQWLAAPFQQEIHLPTIGYQGQAVSLRESIE